MFVATGIQVYMHTANTTIQHQQDFFQCVIGKFYRPHKQRKQNTWALQQKMFWVYVTNHMLLYCNSSAEFLCCICMPHTVQVNAVVCDVVLYPSVLSENETMLFLGPVTNRFQSCFLTNSSQTMVCMVNHAFYTSVRST